MTATGVDLVYRRLLWSDYYGYDYYGYYGWTTAAAHTKPHQAKATKKNSAPTCKLQAYYAWKIISTLDDFRVYEEEKEDQLLWL